MLAVTTNVLWVKVPYYFSSTLVTLGLALDTHAHAGITVPGHFCADTHQKLRTHVEKLKTRKKKPNTHIEHASWQ